jgi:cullin-associated NEDD8-dissociated protein 1
VGKLLIKLEKDADKLVPLQCLSAMSAHSAQCFIPSIKVIIPLLLSYCKDLKCEQYNEQVIKCNKADAALITIVNLFNKIPKEMSEFSNILLNTADVYISFDPGYDESVAVPMEDDSGWGTEAVNDVNNLDDDMSWKVRKGCAQIIESIAKLRPDDVKLTYLKIVEKLQTRLTERDDNVRKEVVNAFVAMIKSSMVEIIDSSMNLSIGNMDSVFGLEPLSMGKQKSSFQDIVSIIPDIIKKLIVMISDKKPDIILLGLQALSAITLAYCNLVHSNIADVVKAFGNIIKDETISCSVSALNILKTLFKNCGSIKIFSPYLENINAIMTTAFNSKHNKIVYEALKASCEYAKILHPIEKQPLSPECAPYATKLYALIEKLFMATELELSIKDISGISMGKIVQYLGSIISDAKMEAILLKYKEKLESESTRIHALKSLFLVIKSIPEGKYEKCLLAIIPEVSALIRQKSRRFRMLGVQLLQAIESKFPKLVQQKSKDFIDDMLHSPLEEDAGITNIILQITVQVLPHISKDLTESVYGMAKKLIKSSNIKDHDISIVNKIFEILVSWKNLDEMFKDLILDIGTCDIASVAMCVAYLCLKFDNKSILIQCIQNVVKTGVEKNLKKLSLYIIGEIGKIKDLSKEKELCDSIFKQLINETEEIKSICANCLGRLVIGNTAYFLPIIMEQIKSKKQSYLMLIAIREVIITNSAALDKYLDKIMSLIQETASAAEQGIRIIIAEIIGKLYQEYKQKAEQWIINLMKDPNPSISSAFLLSFKYATNRQNVDFTLINNVIPQILEILKKSNDLVIKENGFTSLTTLAYNIPNIISLYSDQINALISVEATINKSLIKLIDFGAFKMTEDTGAPVRKQALSLLQVMVMKCNDKVNYSQVFKQVADGLSNFII